MRSRPNVRNHERGSALLIVFLFAAILAVSLYMEMPSYAFEAKRNKEQLLIDRGNEYAHAVKLYYRKFRAYPPSIAALETTNNMRFLRHKFKDPMTGEDNWRLLHAGPGGQLTDSKVNPIGLTANGQNSNTSGSGSSNNSTSSTASAANTSLGFSSPSPIAPLDSSNTMGANGMMAPSNAGGLPQRPPEMPTNSGAAANAANAASADPTQSLLPPTQPFGATAPPNGTGVLAGGSGLMAQSAAAANQGNPMQGVQQLINNPNPPTAPGAPATTGPATTSTGTPSSSSSTSSGMGTLNAGGLAGVASLAKGSSIKTVNDQTSYSLWEFYYDPTKDTSAVGGQSGMGAAAGVPQVNNPFNSNGNSSSPSSNSNSANTPAAPTAGQLGLTPTPIPRPTSTQPQQP